MYGNCQALDNTMKNPSAVEIINEDNQLNENITNIDNAKLTNLNTMTLYVKDVSSYIAGFVIRSLQKKLNCESCIMQLQGNYHCNSLAIIKDRGHLKKPNTDLVTICKVTEDVVRQNHTSCILKTRQKFQLMMNQVKHILTEYNLFENLSCSQISQHKIILIDNIIQKYIQIRLFHETRKMNDKLPIKKKLKKIVHFRHE